MMLCLALGFAVVLPVQAADFTKLLPSETEAVMTFNMKQLVASGIYDKYLKERVEKMIDDSKEAGDFMKMTGLDPLTDIGRIIISGSGSDPSSMSAVVLVEGKFDPAKLNAAMAEAAKKEKDKISVVQDGDLTMYKMSQPDSDTALFATIVDEGMMVMATSKDLVKDTLARRAGTKKGTISKELAGVLRKIDDKATMTMAFVTKGKTEALPIPQPEVAKIVEKIHTISVALDVTKDVSLNIGVGVDDEDSAKELGEQLAAVVPQAKSMVALFAIQQPKLKKPLNDIVNTLKTAVDGQVISLKMVIPSSAVDALMNMLKDNIEN